MTVLTLAVWAVLAGAQTPSPGTACATPTLSPAEREICAGSEAVRLSTDLPQPERRRGLEAAAMHYRRASDISTGQLKVKALVALADTYGAGSLDNPVQREIVLRELIALVPDDPKYAFDLAALQEMQGLTDAAEDTLLGARQRHPQEPDVFRRLAQFYARRIAALQGAQPKPAPTDSVTSAERDGDGVYRIGGVLAPPPRAGTPKYPLDAQNAGIQGGVQAEIVINEQGEVRDATIVRSVPLLDEAALQAVRQWRFEPTIVEGQPVPVRMVVTVNFTLSR